MASIEERLRKRANRAIISIWDKPFGKDETLPDELLEAADAIAELRAALEAIVRDFGEPLPGCDCAYCGAKNRARATLAKMKQE